MRASTGAVWGLFLSVWMWAHPLQAAEGRFVVRAPKVESRELRAEVQELHRSGMLQELTDAVNLLFRVPREVGVRFAECGESNAYFDPEAMEISMCVELLADMDQTLSESYPDEDQRADAVAGAFIAILMHEVGHALVAVLELPITGREEDAVDQLSAWVLIEADMADAVLSSAETYYTAEQEAGDEDLAGEHALDKQRYFNMVCWVYGSQPDAFTHLIKEWELPESRAEQCEAEYAQLNRSWTRLLEGHLRAE